MRLEHQYRQGGSRLGLAMAVLICLSVFQPASAQTEPFVIQDIRIEGLQRISPGSVFAALPVGVGDTVDTLVVRRRQKFICLRQFR